MTPEDAVQLIEVCDRALADLERFDKGTDYGELHLAESFRSIVEPMLLGDDLDADFRRATPALQHGKIRSSIGKLRNGRSFSPGKASQEYGDSIQLLREALERFLKRASEAAPAAAAPATPVGFEELLHPVIARHCLPRYRSGDLRNAVLDGVIAIFDMIRARTGLKLDGKALVTQAFGVQNGLLIFSDTDTDSGRNDQVGFMGIFEGIYIGVRNPKAHTLDHDLTPMKAGQYLVMLSLLARRVEECKERQPK